MTARYALAATSGLVVLFVVAGFRLSLLAALLIGIGFAGGVSWQARRDLRSLDRSPWKPAP